VNYVVTVEGRAHAVEVHVEAGRYRIVVDGQPWVVDARRPQPGLYSLLIDGVSHVADVTPRDGAWVVDVNGDSYTVQVDERIRHVLRARGGGAGSTAGQTVVAPLPGRIAHVSVKPGDAVEPGTPLLVIEAMKMENEMRARVKGTVTEVRVEVGQAVNGGDPLVVIA
jgi:biotin carboxyl carrier protein